MSRLAVLTVVSALTVSPDWMLEIALPMMALYSLAHGGVAQPAPAEVEEKPVPT